MRFLLLFLVSGMLLTTHVQAFVYEIEMHSLQEISEMTDKQILDAFLDAKIEERSSAEFHEGAGFSNAKEYKQRKALLRYIINLRREMQKRNLEVDPIDDWLN